MHKRNIHLTADGGMRVGVKELKHEDYSDKTQSTIVKAWNLASWPEYKSRLWNQEAEINQKRSGSRHSDHGSRSGSRHGDERRHESPGRVGSSSGVMRPGVERAGSGLRHASSH